MPAYFGEHREHCMAMINAYLRLGFWRCAIMAMVTTLACSCSKSPFLSVLDAATTQDGGYTMAGVYRCCAPDAGTSCCEGLEQGMCFAYGGLYGSCRGEGESFEGKVICAHCCEGLQRIAPLVVGEADPLGADSANPTCVWAAPVSVIVCARCGDGICGKGENRCNCSVDCP